MSFTADASALRRLPLFDRVSLRLLEDLVEYASQHRWWSEDGPRDGRREPLVHRLGLFGRRLAGGTRTQRDFHGRWIDSALAASFTLAHAFAGRREELWEMLVGTRPCGDDEPPPCTHWLFLGKDPQFVRPGVPLLDLDLVRTADVLARALGRVGHDVGERAAVALLDGTGISLRCWDGNGPHRSVVVPVTDAVVSGSLREPTSLRRRVHEALCEQLSVPRTTLFHLVCVNQDDPMGVPAWWSDRWRPDFHRIVYLVRPGGLLRPPDRLLELLHPGAWDPAHADGPYFTSVVPTVVLPTERKGRRLGVLAKPCFTSDLATLETEVLDDDRRFIEANAPPERRTPDQRLRRDLCRIRLDPASFAASETDPASRASLDRWARAVTNRQVGIAISGGGATSAALVPFLEALGAQGVPIDVVAAFSGGAILGAYLVNGRLDAYFDRLRGLALTGLVNVAVAYSRAIETFIDVEFDGATLGELDVRFVPVTVALPSDGSPRTCAVVGGTIGEGVRVSGVAIGWFSPAERRGTRYVDAGVALGVPSQVPPRYGADMVIACNSIVSPPGRLLQDLLPAPLGSFLGLLPVTSTLCERFAGRMADYFVGFITSLREAARRGARDADVYYEVAATETPFLDSFLWTSLRDIRDVAARGRHWQDELARSVVLWDRLRGKESS